MVRYLLKHPISVLMFFSACIILALITLVTLPVSLLPNIAIPQVTVQVVGENMSARELENTMVKPLRRQLLQVGSLDDIRCVTRDGIGVINMTFDFGTNTDLAFIEVNEKIDIAMNSFPQDAVRPNAVKASATDIPVFYLNMTQKADKPYGSVHEAGFIEMCGIADNIVRRRIEQLPNVAIADVTGIAGKQLRIVPDNETMEALGIGIEDLEAALDKNNTSPGSMSIKDGHYEYTVRFDNQMRTPADVENIYLYKNGRLLKLKDFCAVDVVQNEEGLSLVDGKKAVTLAIIKQEKGQMSELGKEINATIDKFRQQYPDIDFTINRDQTKLLNYTIANLQQSLFLGLILIFVIAAFMIGDTKSSIAICVSIIVSSVITLLLFYLFDISINLVSVSGMILAVGMMIDSGIIVMDNITQYRRKGAFLSQACIRGTNEMITPMLSSSLTTIAVFLPLIFMSGIAGALFYDQAFSITAGLAVSYIVGIVLLPVFYHEMCKLSTRLHKSITVSPIKGHDPLLKFYDAGSDFFFTHKRLTWLIVVMSLPSCALFYFLLDKERIPHLDYDDSTVKIEWNENISVDENQKRTETLLKSIAPHVSQSAAYVGTQDYMLNNENPLTNIESELYFKLSSPDSVDRLNSQVTNWIRNKYPLATFNFSPPISIFEKLFNSAEPDIKAQFAMRNGSEASNIEAINDLQKEVNRLIGNPKIKIAKERQVNISINQDKLLLYDVSYSTVENAIKSAFRENNKSTLKSFQQYMPINVAGKDLSLAQIIDETMVVNDKHNQYVPLRELISTTYAEDVKNIEAGKDGEYVPINYQKAENPSMLISNLKQACGNTWNVTFGGNYFESRKLMGEMGIILLVSLLLMYFILAAQFESFLQPLIVMSEIPIDIALTLPFIWICGHTLNLMSAIGLVVACGIVINDSILKVDTINSLRKQGWKLLDAIHEAGHRRLRAIVMTSLTTIFAMVPQLFATDIGSELQMPLDIAMIGAMIVGTLVSLFIVPFIYWTIYHKKEIQYETNI